MGPFLDIMILLVLAGTAVAGVVLFVHHISKINDLFRDDIERERADERTH